MHSYTVVLYPAWMSGHHLHLRDCRRIRDVRSVANHTGFFWRLRL